MFFGAYLRKVLEAAGGADGPLPHRVHRDRRLRGRHRHRQHDPLRAGRGRGRIDPTAVQALQALWDNDFLPILFGWSAPDRAGLSVVRYGGLPKWLGWVAIVLAVAGATPIGFVAFIGGALWVLIVSVLLAVRARGASAPPAAASPPSG